MAKQEANSCTPFKTTCGGQALLEGIMMQGPGKRAIVVRRPDGELDITCLLYTSDAADER